SIGKLQITLAILFPLIHSCHADEATFPLIKMIYSPGNRYLHLVANRYMMKPARLTHSIFVNSLHNLTTFQSYVALIPVLKHHLISRSIAAMACSTFSGLVVRRNTADARRMVFLLTPRSTSVLSMQKAQ